MNRLTGFLEQSRRFFAQIFQQGPLLAAWGGLDSLLRNITGAPVRRYSQISPEILVGGQPAMRMLPKLVDWGVTGIVNMRSEYAYPTETDFGSLQYLHLPTRDNTAPTLNDLCEGVAFIQEQIDDGGAVYIHCWEGLGRGPTMAAAYFVTQGMTPDAAWDYIREVRPFIRPTPPQMDRLREFAGEHHEKTEE